MKKKTIYYWSPYLTEIATSKAVINSAYSLKKYFQKYETVIIDSMGEFSNKYKEINEKKISLLKLSKVNFVPFLPKHGKINSRISYLIIFIASFFPLIKLLRNKKPDFLVIHLITSLPLILFGLFNFKTKCILRISGFPIMSKVRKTLWKILLKKVYMVTCPTQGTYNYMQSLKIVDNSKIKLLHDPVICIRDISKEDHPVKYKDYAIAAGRFTKQKNFSFLIDSFKTLVKKHTDFTLLIIGNGEEKKKLQCNINDSGLQGNIKLIPFQENIFPYFRNSKCFFLSSLWEDPGFVLLEAAYSRSFIISSRCPNGPEEIIGNDECGLLYNTNNQKQFLEKVESFLKMDDKEIMIKKKNAIKKSKDFSIFHHAKAFDILLGAQ